MTQTKIIFAISLFVISVATAQLVNFPVPGNVTGETSSDAVSLSWSRVDGAAQYFVAFENGPSQLTPNNQITFGGLDANTEYTVIISAADENGTTSSQSAVVTIKTQLQRVSNLRVTAATNTKIEITWDARNDTTGYNVVVKSDDDTALDGIVEVNGNNAVVSGLEPFMFYNIYVMPTSSEGKGDEAVIRGRTDGSGVRIKSLWEGYEEGVFGGEAMFFRPLVIPKQPYLIKADFPCGLASALVWNAELDKRASDVNAGMIIIRQQKLWERQKTEIGVNFYFDVEGNGNICEIGNNSIAAEFGVPDPFENEIVTTTPIPVSVEEWRNTSRMPVTSAGIVYIKLRDVYNETGVLNATNPKPSAYQYIIVVNSGQGCPGGIDFRYGWGLTAKSSDDIGGSQPGALYFVQKHSQWYSNEPGFIYGYDPDVCMNRNGISVQVIAGGPLVDEVINAKDFEKKE